jgi:glycosyltransferase involved in cell wall biosynthesis
VAVALFGDVKAFVTQFQPDVLHLNVPGVPAMLSRDLLHPDAVMVAGFHCALDGWPGMWPIARTIAERAAAIVVPSHFLAGNIAAVLSRSAGALRVIEHGIPEAALLSVPPLAEPPPMRFLFAGRLVPPKAPHIATAAIDHLGRRDVRAELLIAGEGPLRERLVKIAGDPRLAGRVILLGELSQDSLAERLADVAALVVPSLSKESFSLISAEAALAGRPVLASRRGALAETVVDDETGLLFEPGDAAGLADVMHRVLLEPGLAARLGSAARTRARFRYRFSAMVDQYETLYGDVAKTKARVPQAQA